jgi:DNA-binding MarR family transcriptional regulator
MASVTLSLVSMGVLAEPLGLDPTTLTRSLRPLQKAELLAISKRAAGRLRFVSLTREGERTLARAVPKWREVQRRFVAALGGEHWLNFRDELERFPGVAVRLEHLLQRNAVEG